MAINMHQLGKHLGATLTNDRTALNYYYGHMIDTDADKGVRTFARGVIMGAAQVLDPTADSIGKAIEVTGLDQPAPPAPLTGDELVLALSRAVDTVREGAHTPVWTPLEAVLPYDWCGGFMFMGGSEYLTVGPNGFERRTVFLYKHGITRHYLNIGDDLNAYTYRSTFGDVDEPVYCRVRMEGAMAVAFDGIEQFGADRTTKYDAAFIADRNARLVAAGYTVVG